MCVGICELERALLRTFSVHRPSHFHTYQTLSEFEFCWLWLILWSLPHCLPGLVQKVDQRLPVANEYLLLSGGAREGVLDLNPEDLGDYAKGADFDLDFTLLVPALKLHDRNQPVTLDMRHSPPCHSWLSLRLCDSNILSRWSVCCQEENGLLTEEDEEEEGEMGKWKK